MAEAAYGNLPFNEAIKYFSDKGIMLSPDSWRDLWQQAHARAFTVAQATKMDVLAGIRDEVEKAVKTGQSLGQFKKDLRQTLERKGWFAPKGERAEIEMPDGTVRKRLTAWRVENVYKTNLQTAYSVGRYKQMMASAIRIYWQYMAIMDAVTRPEHGAQHGKVYHRDHPFWNQWFPPNGFGCRCYVKTISGRQMKQRNLTEETQGVKEKPDEGWRYNPGKAGLDAWKPDLEGYKKEARDRIEAAMKRPVFVPAATDEDIKEFIYNRDRLPNQFRPFVTQNDVEAYKALGASVYTAYDGSAGYAVTKDKELISVFSKPGAKRGGSAVKNAIEQGAETLDCFDGYLPGFYGKFGFEEVDRMGWDDQYAPEGWDADRFGKPDVVLMRRKGKAK